MKIPVTALALFSLSASVSFGGPSRGADPAALAPQPAPAASQDIFAGRIGEVVAANYHPLQDHRGQSVDMNKAYAAWKRTKKL